MCGIVGFTGDREAQEIVLDCLRRLEYRGYDSAGIAMVSENSLTVKKSVGEISVLESQLPKMPGKTGIAHTRWATHGKPTTENAHPFTDCNGEFAVVHNGIITNYMSLKEQLLKRGHKFTSETDSEVLAHMLEEATGADLKSKVLAVLRQIGGSFAIAVVHKGHDEIVAARNESPLVVGIGHDENFVASDVTALLKYTNEFVYLLDREAVRITPSSVGTLRPRRRAVREGAKEDKLESRGRGEERVSSFHAEGDIRAASRHPRIPSR